MRKKRNTQDKCIFGKGVILEPFSKKHLSADYVQWLNDPEVCRFNSHGVSKYTLLKAQKYLKSLRGAHNKKVFAILMEQGKRHVGNISLCLSPKNNSGEIAILIGAKECWGKGVGTEAFRLLVGYAFETLCLHRVYAGMMERNIGMMRLVEKLGFHSEGVQRDAMFKNKRYWDVAIWAKINPKD